MLPVISPVRHVITIQVVKLIIGSFAVEYAISATMIVTNIIIVERNVWNIGSGSHAWGGSGGV